MGSISVSVDVDVDYDEISDHDVIDIIEDRLHYYEILLGRYTDPEKIKKVRIEADRFKDGVMDALGIDPPEGKTLLQEEFESLFEEIRNKFTLDEVESFVKTKR